MRPLADLHRHLDGSLRATTLRALADAEGVDVPDDVRFFVGMGLNGALDRFALTLRVLQSPDAVRRVAREICEDAAANGVTTLEIRFGPHLHLDHGARMDDIIDAVCDGANEVAACRAGVILCGLYGDSPGLLKTFVELAASRPRVVGLDLAGGPHSGQDWSLGDYADAFGAARELGLGRTVHAGEGRPAAEIRAAVELLHAQRIGHGCTLLDDPALVDLVVERGVVIEACPTSNLHTGAIEAIADHPLPHWLARGVRACVNTDNTLFSDVDAPAELARAAAIPGMTRDRVDAVVATGHAARFTR